MLVKNQNFGQKLKLRSKTEILVKVEVLIELKETEIYGSEKTETLVKTVFLFWSKI